MNEYGLLSFKEYGEANGPSITTLFSDTKYENQDVIADYLDGSEEESMKYSIIQA